MDYLTDEEKKKAYIKIGVAIGVLILLVILAVILMKFY